MKYIILSLISLIGITLSYEVNAGTKTSFYYCDIVFSEMRFGDTVSPELEKQCRNRFTQLVHREKAWLRNYYRIRSINFPK